MNGTPPPILGPRGDCIKFADPSLSRVYGLNFVARVSRSFHIDHILEIMTDHNS